MCHHRGTATTKFSYPRQLHDWMQVRWDLQTGVQLANHLHSKGKGKYWQGPYQSHLEAKSFSSPDPMTRLCRFQTDKIILEKFFPPVALLPLLEVCRKNCNKYKTLASKQKIIQLSTWIWGQGGRNSFLTIQEISLWSVNQAYNYCNFMCYECTKHYMPFLLSPIHTETAHWKSPKFLGQKGLLQSCSMTHNAYKLRCRLFFSSDILKLCFLKVCD